ncbi:MAG: hypothetical protein ACHQFW_00315 [Chitinophagales bacterium]
MLEQLILMAQERLGGISRDIPELNDLDSTQVTDVTSQTLINTIMQQAKKGNVLSLREMLSGIDTPADHKVIERLKDPIMNQLQSRLNISGESAKQLAVIALPIIMNMLNHKVQNAKTGGFNIHEEMNTLNTSGGGLLKNIVNLFGANNQNSRTINTILQNLIH